MEKEEIIKIYKGLLKIPTISAEGSNLKEAADYISKFLKSIGFNSTIMGNSSAPVVYGEYNIGAKKTLLIYNHYDVQPVDPRSEWKSDPFDPVVVDNRIFARGSADNKGALVSRLYGIIKAIENNSLNVNLKILYEGEEEIGSPSLEEFVKANKELLKSDYLLMEGSTIDPDENPVVFLGVKGLLYVELVDVIGGSDIHSSNASIVPNPIWNIIIPISQLYDGRIIKIPHFYDDIEPLNEKQIEILKNYNFNRNDYLDSFHLKHLKFDDNFELVKSLFADPTFNIDGFSGGYSGPGSKTIIPMKAIIKIDFRLVPNQDPMKIFDSFVNSLREAGFSGEINMLSAEYPVRTSPTSMIAEAVIKSANKVFKKVPVININMPGTQPMALFIHNLGIKEGISAIDPRDSKLSNWHAPNESIDLDNFFKAAEHMYEFLNILS